MKCNFCKKEYSDSVFPYHLLRCEAKIKAENSSLGADSKQETKKVIVTKGKGK
jgi:hypothetical protein